MGCLRKLAIIVISSMHSQNCYQVMSHLELTYAHFKYVQSPPSHLTSKTS